VLDDPRPFILTLDSFFPTTRRSNARMAKSPPLSVFCSYSHKDESLRTAVAVGLAGLIRDRLIHDVWYDRQISGGTNWAYAIDRQIDQSDIILLLVSSNFIASEYCMGKEVVRSLERHKKNEARVVPIILEPCDWETAVFAELQVLPVGGKPLRAWNIVNKNRLVEVSKGMRKVVEEFSTSANSSATRRLIAPDAGQTVLAYLCDRVEQDRQLRDAWNVHYDSFALRRRPFVCVVHGPVQEDHAGYLRRLSDYSFPQGIGFGRNFEIHQPRRVQWSEDSADKASALSGMLRNLAWELKCPAQLAEVSATLYRSGETCVVYYELFTNSKSYGDPLALQSFFEFWKNWPDLPLHQKLIVALSVQYKPKFAIRFPREGTDIVTCATQSGRLSAVVLDELPPVSSKQVKDWVRHPEVERFCDVENNLTAWEAAIDETFGDRSQMPMEELVVPLNRMLNEYQRRPS
jgi:hypothetical protein